MGHHAAVSRLSVLSSVLALALSPVLPAQGNAAASEKTLPRQSSEVGLPLAEAHSYKEFTAFGQIWTINQDRHGVMYIGVSGGDLIEYDGVTWRKIRTGSDTVRSIAFDESGKAWVGGNGNFGYIEPDPSGVERFVSILDKVPEQDRQFTDVWQALITPQGIFFRSYEKLFRWDGKTMHSWSRGAYGRFQALSAVRGHIYTAQNGVGLQEIVGDDLRPVRGGEGYKDAAKLFLHPYDDTRMIVSQREGMLTLYDGAEGHALRNSGRQLPEKPQTLHIHVASRRKYLHHYAGRWCCHCDARRQTAPDVECPGWSSRFQCT